MHFLSLVLAIAVVFCSQLAHAAETAELDLIFPRNETYHPIYPFPIVFALRNPAALWPFDFTLSARLKWWDPLENRIAWAEAGFEHGGHFPNSDSGIYDHSHEYPGNASEPLWIINSSIAIPDLTQSTTGAIVWEFGLDDNCTGNVDPEDTVGWPGHFKNYVELSFARGGILPFDAFDSEQCPVAVGAIGIAGQMQPEGPLSDTGTCPILMNEQPEPEPCALPIDERLGTRVTQAMMSSISCDATSWPDPTATSCEQLSGAQTVKSSLGLVSVALIGIMIIYQL